MEYKEVIFSMEEGVATITLNNPEVMNAISATMIAEWADCLERSGADEAARVVMVTGSGRAFCAGGNVRNIAQGQEVPREPRPGVSPFRGVISAARALKKPYIAAVNGPAIGGGMDMASLADIRLASEAARFGTGYIRMANVPALGAFFLLPRIVGLGNALDLLWTGRIIDAREAFRLGYVQALYPAEEFLNKAREFCLKLAKGPSVAINFDKQLVYDALKVETLEEALPMLDKVIPVIQQTEDIKEGPRAFLERREPQFKGR